MDEMGTLTGYIGLLQAGFPTLRIDRCAVLGEGWDSVALLVNDQDVFRIAKRPDAAQRQAREATLLPLLEDRLPLPIPRYTATWSDPSWPGLRIVGYRLIPGESLEVYHTRPANHTDPGHAASQAAELGAFLRALHAVPVEEARRHGATGGDAASRYGAYRGFYDMVRADMLPLFTAQEQEAIVAFWTRYLDDDTCFAFTSTLVHRDLVAEHVLCDPATGRVTGVIDWGDAGIDDPAIDFAGLRRQLGDEFTRQMLAVYAPDSPTDPTMLRRMDFYAGMEPFHEIHFGQMHGDAAHLARGVELARTRFL